ncbi:MAG TPA: hypothetical protein VF698_06930 [Thermoanaerobaculia bacterium]|jgi:hypothetical protein
MNELLMIEAALFQLRAAQIEDPQFRLGLTVLASAVQAARDSGVNAARVNDIDFALNDLAGAVDFLGADAEKVTGPLALLRDDVNRLRESTALPAELVARIGAFRTKLKARRSAIERQTYREGGGEEPLPHPPEELRDEAVPIRRELTAAGFETPALDALLEDPQSLRFHSLTAILDELEVIAG